MAVKNELVQQLMEPEAEVLDAKKRLQAGRGQHAWISSRYQDGVSKELAAIYSE